MANGMTYSSGQLQNFLQQRDQRQGQNMPSMPAGGTSAYQSNINRLGQQQANVGYVAQMNQQNLALNRQFNAMSSSAENLYNQAVSAGMNAAKPPSGYNPAAMQSYTRNLLQQMSQYQQQQAAQQKAYEEALRAWPTYEQAMSGYRNDPLTELYTSRRYQEAPLSREEYDYLRLSEQYGGLSGPQLAAEQRRSGGQYMPGHGQSRDSYAYYQWLSGELKGRQEEQRRRDGAIRRQADQMLSGFPQPGGQRFVHILTPEMRRVMGVTDADVAQSRQAYQLYRAQSGAWDQYRESVNAQNARQQQADMQSAAARGFYNTPGQGVQTPYAYQTWGGA